jgi:hypothetical protein
MPERIRVEIGGVGFLFRCHDPDMRETHENRRYLENFIRPGKNDIAVDIHVGTLPRYARTKPLFISRENWSLYEHNRKRIFEIYETHSVRDRANAARICIMEARTPKATVYVSSPDRSWSVERIMRTLGQLMTIGILHRYEGALFHAAAVAYKGKGLLFPGASGAGKTTLSRLWQEKKGATALSDDRAIVRKAKGRCYLYGSPWPGEARAVSEKRAPLAGIFFLSKAKKNRIVPLEKKRGLHLLATSTFPAIWDKESIDFSLGLCESLIRDLPCYRFDFLPEGSAVATLERFLAEQ